MRIFFKYKIFQENTYPGKSGEQQERRSSWPWWPTQQLWEPFLRLFVD